MNKNLLITVLLLVSVTFSFSQEKFTIKYSDTPLQQVLTDLESKTNFIFSYSIEVVKNKFITLKKQEVTFDEITSELTSQTELIFDKISKNQITISKPRRICGYLYDNITNEALPFVNAIINSKLYTITDENGFFSFENPRNNSEKITLSILGYQSKEIILSTNNNCLSIKLNSISPELDEVIILGYITTGIDRNKDGSVSVDSKKLGILPGLVSADISQSIQLIPGISTLDESASGIQIRGGSPDQNLILYDDIKLYNTGYLYGMFSLFNPFATQKATVFRSGY